MEGRWNLCAGSTGDLWTLAPDDVGDDLPDGYVLVPVVPCDDAAIERGVAKLRTLVPFDQDHRELAEAVLRAAGETP
jgi:hypothetical protein